MLAYGMIVFLALQTKPSGFTTRENPSSSAGFVLTSSAGRRATNKALHLLLSSNACPHTLLLGQIAEAFVEYHATAKVTTCSVFSVHR